MYEVVYLTGPPASGKSTVTRALAAAVKPLEVFEYGQRLTDYLSTRDSASILQAQLRERSSSVVTPADVARLDEILLDFVSRERLRSHVIVDSHPVTKERYGFRVTPFKLADFEKLSPTQIWMLYTEPSVAITRITKDPDGRPKPTEWEASFHTLMQSSVAITYGMQVGIPVHLIDADRPVSELVTELSPRLIGR